MRLTNTYLRLGLPLIIAIALVLPASQAPLSAAPTPSTVPVFVTNSGPNQAIPITGNVSNPVPIQDVDRPTAQPFRYHANLTWTAGFAFANADGTQHFQVPAGKRLVIEFVSLQAQVNPGDNVLFARLDFDPGIVLSLTHAGTDFQNNEVFTATHRVFAIVEPGANVIPTAFCKGLCTTITPSLGLSISVSGYLTDV